GDARILAGHQRGPLRLGIDVDRLDRQAAGLPNHRRCTGSRTEIYGPAAQELERLVRAVGENPPDLNPFLGKLLLQPTLVFEQDADRIVVGPVNAYAVR